MIDIIRQNPPNRAISPKASQTAINAVSNILGGMGTSLMASNTQLIPAVTGLNPDLDNVTHLEAQSDSTEGFEGYPGIWMTSLKMQYIASGLMDTIYDNQLDEDGVLRRSAGAKTSQEDLDFQKKHEDTGNTSHRSRSLDSFSVIGVPTSTSKVSHGTELKLTPLPKVVSASSSLYAMSNCSSPLEYTSSESDIPIDKEA
ncbi:hypothetical protein J4Q44_G00257500 [Coregonus suidteri]|uniref:Uncharacterized protein n=1 Tax=Coregonus suidteri TaxID=861788 RepID=A0AAN8LGQ1_9TELE